MKNISDELTLIAATLDLIYVRALNAADLNQTLQGVKVDKPLLVYADLGAAEFPDIDTNFQYYESSVKIFLLDISKLPDPTALEIDEQLAPLFVLGNAVYDALTRSELIFLGANVERGTMSAAESIELTDEVLNGWEIDLILPIKREVYFCPPTPPPVISPEAQEVLDNMPLPLVGTTRAAVIAFVDSQSISLGSGNWQFIDAFAHGKLPGDANKLWKWKQNDAMINNGADLFSGGWNFNASLMQWIDTNFNPTLDAVNSSVEDIFAGSLITRIATLDGNQPYWGNVGSASTRVQIQTREFFEIGYALTGDNRRTNIVIGSDELLVCARTGANTSQLYRNGIKVDDGTDGVSGLGWANLNIALGARLQSGNVAAEFQDCGQSVWFWGGAIGFDQKDFYDNLAILNNAL